MIRVKGFVKSFKYSSSINSILFKNTFYRNIQSKMFERLRKEKLPKYIEEAQQLYKKIVHVQHDYFTDKEIKDALEKNHQKYNELKAIKENLKKCENKFFQLENDLKLKNANIITLEAQRDALHHENASIEKLVALEKELRELRIDRETLRDSIKKTEEEMKKLAILEKEKMAEWVDLKNHLNEILVITNTRGNIMRFWQFPFWNFIILLVTAIFGYIVGRLGLKKYIPAFQEKSAKEFKIANLEISKLIQQLAEKIDSKNSSEPIIVPQIDENLRLEIKEIQKLLKNNQPIIVEEENSFRKFLNYFLTSLLSCLIAHFIFYLFK